MSKRNRGLEVAMASRDGGAAGDGVAPELRLATPRDVDFLWAMLGVAAHVPKHQDIRNEAKNDLRLAAYVEEWGLQVGDIGFVAYNGNGNVGAAWARRWNATRQGYVVDSEIELPELAMGVLPANRSRGIGTMLLRALQRSAGAMGHGLCLSVRSDSPAFRLYARAGFETVAGSQIRNRIGGLSVTMVWHPERDMVVPGGYAKR